MSGVDDVRREHFARMREQVEIIEAAREIASASERNLAGEALAELVAEMLEWEEMQ